MVDSSGEVGWEPIAKRDYKRERPLAGGMYFVSGSALSCMDWINARASCLSVSLRLIKGVCVI